MRIGVIGADTVHTLMLCAYLNGWRKDIPFPDKVGPAPPNPWAHRWLQTLREGELRRPPTLPITGARVARFWAADDDDKRLLGLGCDIAEPCTSAEECCEEVDGVLILTADPYTHLPLARECIRRRLPFFVDKPLTPDKATAKQLAAEASNAETPWFSCSALRFSPYLDSTLQIIDEQVGNILHVYSQVPLKAETYAIHAVETVNRFLGNSVETIRATAVDGLEAAVLTYAGGAAAIIANVTHLSTPAYNALVVGDRGAVRAEHVSDGRAFVGLAEAFVDMVHTRRAPVASDECTRLHEIVLATIAALGSTREIRLT